MSWLLLRLQYFFNSLVCTFGVALQKDTCRTFTSHIAYHDVVTFEWNYLCFISHFKFLLCFRHILSKWIQHFMHFNCQACLLWALTGSTFV